MKKYIYLGLIAFTSLTGCKKSYLDINNNPNSPTEGSITPDLILPRALHASAQTVIGGNAAVTGRWMGYWSRGGDYGANTEEETYNITTNFGTAVWNGQYDLLYDYHVMEQKSKATGQKFFEGIAKTMKVIGFSYLVDVYNNVPYSKAFDIAGNITPAYDKGPDIYKDLFLQLDQAIVLIDAAAPGEDKNLEKGDIMFRGTTFAQRKVMWKKLINTIRLKMVVRLSKTTLVTPATELAKVTSDGFLGAGETAAVNPGYAKAFSGTNVSQQNPFWDTYEQDVAGVYLDRFNRANNYVLNFLRSNGDTRYTRYFDPSDVGGVYAGYDYGVPTSNVASDRSSRVSGPGLARSFSQDQWLLTSVESLFLQAEATQRGWLNVTTPQLAYEAAVRESFVWLGVTNPVATANSYLATSTIANWNDPANTNKLKLISTQKYLSLVGIANIEAWMDYRRLDADYPAVPLTLAPGAAAAIPKRYRYPQSEYNFNPSNVAAENDPNPITSGVFWDL